LEADKYFGVYKLRENDVITVQMVGAGGMGKRGASSRPSSVGAQGKAKDKAQRLLSP
jgi:hypothetical protein